MIDLICKNCGNKFKRFPYVLKDNRGKYCSKKCAHVAFKYLIKGGHPNSLKNLKRITSKRAKELGFGKWMKGKKLSEETKRKIGKSLKGGNKGSIKKGQHIGVSTEFKKGHTPVNKGKKIPKISGPNNYHWKGGYQNILSLNRKRRIMRLNAIGTHNLKDWEKLKQKYKHKCVCCNRGEPEITLTEDHVIPLSKGGSDYIENIQPLCKSCNSKKNSKIKDYRR